MALKAVFEPNFTPGERRIQRHVCCVSTSVVCVNFDGCYVAAALPASCMCIVPVTTVEGALKNIMHWPPRSKTLQRLIF